MKSEKPKTNSTKNLKFLFIPTIFFISLGMSAFPEDSNSIAYSSKPESIMLAIKSKGAEAVVNELYADWNVWTSVLRKIATGDESWLKIAVFLKPGTDAGASEMLVLAVGEALEHNPKSVFRITSKIFDLSFICSGPDIDDDRYHSYELSIKALDLRIKNIRTIKTKAFKKTCDECIKYLEASKKGIARFYGVEQNVGRQVYNSIGRKLCPAYKARGCRKYWLNRQEIDHKIFILLHKLPGNQSDFIG